MPHEVISTTAKNFLLIAILLVGAAACNERQTAFQQINDNSNENAETVPHVTPKPSLSEIIPSGVKNGVPFRNRYTNLVFGFSIAIPKCLTAFGNRPPFPQHGAGIILSENPDSYLYVDGSYNALEWHSLGDAADFNFEFLKKNYPNAKEIESKETRLSELPALRSRTEFVRQGENRIEETVMAFRNAEGEKAEIVYTISLDTTEERFREDIAKFDEIVNSWKLIKAE